MNGERRVIFHTADGLALEGVLHLPGGRAAHGVVVCHPHPLYGGDMNNGVVLTVCQAALAVGAAALRFNFRGTGGSEGRHEQGEGERLDVAAAVEYLRRLPEGGARQVAVAGYSFGAAVALSANIGDLAALVAVSAPTMALPSSLPRLPYPLLLVSGDEDEYSDPDDLTEFAQAAGVELRFVAGADHFWWGHETELREIVAAFLGRHLG